jgi:hypothetical protein
MILKLLLVVLSAAGVCAMIWASDRITFQGERTVYTVQCLDGAWDGLRCTGRMVAGDRHLFRASKNRQEVLYWITGSKTPSGKFADCRVRNRGDWSCNVAVNQPPTIAHEMAKDRPVNSVAGLDLPFRAVHKWKWWILHLGLPVFAEAEYDGREP